jgi:hypothetical protein
MPVEAGEAIAIKIDVRKREFALGERFQFPQRILTRSALPPLYRR